MGITYVIPFYFVKGILMTRTETIVTIIAALKQSLVKPDDFIELWLINELIDDANHLKLVGDLNDRSDPYSVLRIDYECFSQLNEPHGVYNEKHIKVDYAGQDIYINTDAVYKVVASPEYIDELNRRFVGATWELSNTEGYAILNVSFDEQAKYFNTTH